MALPPKPPDRDPGPAADRAADPADRETADLALPEPPAGWSRGAIAVTMLLIGLFVGIGLFAAWTVTPGPDEEALARPEGADVVVAGGRPSSWDPVAVSDGTSAQVLSQVFEGLTVLDARSRIQPALARAWQVEDGGRRLVFELREGLTFSDGTELRAEDVRRSWLRIIDPAAPSPLSSLLDGVVGAAAYARGEGSEQDVGLHAEGNTLTVELDSAASYFPAVAASATLAVVPPGIDGQALGPDEVGDGGFVASGAYVPVGQQADRIDLERNERYWSGPAPIGRDTIVTDDGGRSEVDNFEDGAVDWRRSVSSDASGIRYER